MASVTETCGATRSFRVEEGYSLTNQLKGQRSRFRSNIAEGQVSHSPQEFHRFLSTVRGSLGGD